MAGVAQNVQVVSNDKSVVFEQPDLTFNINSSESSSLQELIDSELALRISKTDSQEPESELTGTSHNSYVETIPVRTVHPITFELEPDINEQFIFSEKEHTSFQLIKNNVNINTSESLVTDFETILTDDLNLYENLIDIKSNTSVSEQNSVANVVFQDADSTELLNTKDVETPITDLDSTAEVPPEPIIDPQLIDITNVDDSQPLCVDIIETVTKTDQEHIENIVTNCDLSEQNNKISTNIVDVIKSVNSDNDVNNSMSDINCSGVDLINNECPEVIFPDEPDSSSSPLHSGSPTSPIFSEGVLSESSPVQVDDSSPISPFKAADLSSSSQPDVIIQVNGAAPVIEENGFDNWMTVEDAMKDPNDSSPDENIAQQSEIFDVFETIDDGHYEDVIERSRLASENSLDNDLVSQADSVVMGKEKNVDQYIDLTTEADSLVMKEEKNIDQSDGEATRSPVVHDQSPNASVSDHSLSDGDVTESSTSMTKTVKKKKSLEGGEAVVTRTKKTKKTKKSDEKENHISVVTNGHDNYTEIPQFDLTSSLDDDELSNVCVRDLKQTYCREAAKSLNAKVPSEEPIPPAVSIRELRRSFGDLHKACETNEQATIAKLSPVDANLLKARSLGDLRRLTESPQLKRNIHTGVSVKALAASYWSLISHEPGTTSPPNIKYIPRSPMKSSFSKFDQLSKKAVLHVRSSDSAKAQKQFQSSAEGVTTNPSCKACGKTVFAMEQIKAERSVWHKNCFRCKECNKQLTVDIYQSHEGELYCKPHFRELFKPKAVLDNTDDEPVRRRKPEMIIRENQPMELPPDVVRASDKADLGLEELTALNVKSRYQVFEKPTESEVERSPSTVNVKRSPSILSKLAKFQKKGMDVGVTDESLNGVEYEVSSSSSEDENEEGVIKSSKLPERPVSFNKMDDVKRCWESGQTARRAEMREEHKKEIQNIRSRLFMGKQGKMKEMYEQAVAESEGRAGNGSAKKEVEQLRCEKARLMKERFEKGEPITDSEDEDGEKKKTKETEDMSVFEAGISKKSRSLFMELDATAAKTQQSSPASVPANTPTPRARTTSQNVSRQVSDDVVRSSDLVEDVVVETADVTSKFKFFETYKAPEKERKAFRITPPRDGQVKEESPDREIYRDPEIVRSEDQVDDDELVKRSHTTSKMLSLFRQMEEAKEPVPEGLKPLKCFTPPPDYKEEQSGSSGEEDDEESEEECEESEEDTGIVRASDKIEDEFLKQAQNAARAKALKEKFEHWEPEKQSVNNAINLLDTEQESIESTKSLRARFESLKSEQPKEKARPKVNRFVEAPATNICAACDKKVYHLEKVEASGKLFHKDCFRCTQCKCKLRMESYTLNNGHVYCLPHFRQLFIAKGNYDEGFGSDQHKRKWESTQTVNGAH